MSVVMTEKNPTPVLSKEDFELAFMIMSQDIDATPNLDPQSQACIERARDLQKILDNPDTRAYENLIAVKLRSLNRSWPHHDEPVDVTGWVSADDLGPTKTGPEELDAIFGVDRLEMMTHQKTARQLGA